MIEPHFWFVAAADHRSLHALRSGARWNRGIGIGVISDRWDPETVGLSSR